MTLAAPHYPSPSEDGVYPNHPEEEYNAWTDTVRSGWLNVLDKRTPAHLEHARANPQGDTDALRLGRLIHQAVLEPDRFERLYARGPDVKLNTKAGKELWERAERENPGKELLRFGDWEVCMGIRDSIEERADHEPVREALASCRERELTVLWTDPATGLRCRMRADAVAPYLGLLLDVKSAKDGCPEKFERVILERGYDLQAGHYRMGAAEAGWSITDSLLLTAEKEPPYLCALVPLSESVVQEGQRKARRALDLFAECQKAGHWPGYPQYRTASYPAWYWRHLEQEEGR